MISSIFGGDTGISYEDLKRRKLIAESLIAQSMKTPRNVGEGLTAIGNALSGTILQKRHSRKQAEMDKASSAMLASLLGGGGGVSPFAPPRAPAGGMAPPTGGTGAPTPPPAPPATDGAPVGGMDPEMAAKERALAEIVWSLGPKRPNKPTSDVLLTTLRKGAAEVYGPGAKIVATSGTEGDLPQHGSNRHKTGKALDFAVKLPDGTLVSGDAMDPLATWAAKNGILGIGYGGDYMGGNHFHMDMVAPGAGQAHTWGGRGKARRDELTGYITGGASPADPHAGHNHPPGAHGAAPPSFSSVYPPAGGNRVNEIMQVLASGKLNARDTKIAEMLLGQAIAANKPMDPMALARLGLMTKADARAERELQWKLSGGGAKPPKDPLAKAKALAEMEGHTPGTPEYNQAVVKHGAAKGMVIESDGKGGFSVRTGGASGGSGFKEYEAKAKQFYTRMKAAEPRVTEFETALEKKGGPSLLDTTAEGMGSVGNFLKSPEYQAYTAAAREWIAGLLRLDSGAAVPDTEFTRYFSTYFIAPGDTPETIRSKKAARDAATEALRLIQPDGGGPPPDAPDAGVPDAPRPAEPVGDIPPIPEAHKNNPAVMNAWEFMTPEERALFMK